VTRITPTARDNQRRRTRKDLLQATARLLKQGRKPSLEEVAEEALMSRATAYRYFPGVEALLVEALVDVAFPELGKVLDDVSSDDPVVRLERVDDAIQKMIAENEAHVRMLLAYSHQQQATGNTERNLPIRQNRRTPLIEAALAPARDQFETAKLDTLTAALALVIGTEAMVVCRDVLQLDDTKARNVRQWAIRTLVEAAKKPRGKPSRQSLKTRRRSHVHKQ
jgi:AcrR family transcriptional regulator